MCNVSWFQRTVYFFCIFFICFIIWLEKINFLEFVGFYDSFNEDFFLNNVSLCTGLRPASFPFVSGDGFRCLANYVMDELTEENSLMHDINYGLAFRNEVALVFVASHFIHRWFPYWHNLFNGSLGYILLSGNSDINNPVESLNGSATTGLIYLENAWLVHWYAQNLDAPFAHSKLSPIPIGIENLHFKRHLPKIYEVCRSRAIEPVLRRFRVLMNFTPNNSYRRRVLLLYSGQPELFTLSGILAAEGKDHLAFIEDIRNHQFMISPRGGGLDSHRTWEALACGTAVILLNDTMHSLFDGMPVLLLPSWEMLTAKYLKLKLPSLLGTDGFYMFTHEKHLMNYWINMLEARLNRKLWKN